MFSNPSVHSATLQRDTKLIDGDGALGEQAGCLLSQCAVASIQTFTNIRGTFAVIYVPPKKLKDWLKGLKGLKRKPFSLLSDENQQE